jgi:diphthamide biosynthesis methyltransferase
LLLEMERNADEGFQGDGILQTAPGVGIARAGSDDATVKADFLKNLKDYDFGGPLHILIVPGKLHFMEAKALQDLAGAPPEIVQMAED